MSTQSLGRTQEIASALDCPVLVGNRCARLMTSADGSLLIKGAYSRSQAEILIGRRPGDNPVLVNLARQRDLPDEHS